MVMGEFESYLKVQYGELVKGGERGQSPHCMKLQIAGPQLGLESIGRLLPKGE